MRSYEILGYDCDYQAGDDDDKYLMVYCHVDGLEDPESDILVLFEGWLVWWHGWWEMWGDITDGEEGEVDVRLSPQWDLNTIPPDRTVDDE